jgi:hypothetical protein
MFTFKQFITETKLETISSGKSKDKTGDYHYTIHGTKGAAIITSVWHRRPETLRVDITPDIDPTSRKELINLYGGAARAARWGTQRQIKPNSDVSITMPHIFKDPEHPLHNEEKKIRKRLFRAAGLPHPLRPHTDFPDKDEDRGEPVPA